MYKYYDSELYHFGVKGMKWGVRNYQNEDGSYKSGAEGRYNGGSAKARYKLAKKQAKADLKATRRRLFDESTKFEEENDRKYSKNGILTDEGLRRQTEYYKKFDSDYNKATADYKNAKKAAKEEYKNSDEYKARAKKIAVGAAVVAGTALAAYGGYKLAKAYGNSKKDYENAISSGKEAYSNFMSLQKSGLQKSVESKKAYNDSEKLYREWQHLDGKPDSALRNNPARLKRYNELPGEIEKMRTRFNTYQDNANLDFKNSFNNLDSAVRYKNAAKNTAYYKINRRLPGAKKRNKLDLDARIGDTSVNGRKDFSMWELLYR